MKIKFRIWMRGSALLLALWGGFGSLLWAQRTPPESDFPVFGVGAGQIFRFAVSGVGTSDRPADSSQICHAALSFRDTQNRAMSGLSQDVSLGPGQAAFLELDSRMLGLRPRARIDFRPVLTPFSDTGSCQSSFHVLDGFSGRIMAFDTPGSPKTIVGCPSLCQGLPLGALFSLGTGQTFQVQAVRSTVPFDVNNMPLPCDVTLEIWKVGEGVLASQVTGPLLPGQAAMVSVNANTLNLRLGETAFLAFNIIDYPVNISLPGQTCSACSSVGCIFSYQVVDNFTNWTTLISAPLLF